MGLYFNVNDEIFLLHKDFLFTGDVFPDTWVGYTSYYLGDPELWPEWAYADLLSSLYPNAETIRWNRYYETYPNIVFGKMLGFEIGASGATQYSGDWEDDFPTRYQPPYKTFNLYPAISPFSSEEKVWYFTDGTQTIYFSENYIGNYFADEAGKWTKHYVGYGADDAGSLMYDSGNDFKYDINFNAVTTAAVTVSPYPAPIVKVNVKIGENAWERSNYPDFLDLGDVYLIYPYSPYTQNYIEP